jgi:hypothetical protein
MLGDDLPTGFNEHKVSSFSLVTVDGARRGVCQVTESVACFSDLTFFREVQEELRLYLYTVLSDWPESSQLNIKSKDATPFSLFV